MSRATWYNKVRNNGRINTDEEMLEALKHKKLAGRTSDPQAADYDEAAALFVQGVGLARSRDMDAGRAQIATAFLLDSRSIKFIAQVPQNPKIKAKCVDLELLLQLSEIEVPDAHQISCGGHVLRLVLAIQIGGNPQEGQNVLASALMSVNYLIQRLNEEPHLGDHDSPILGGCMTRTNMLYHRSTLHMALGNHKKAIGDLTKALDYDADYFHARDARASLWASMNLQDDKTIFEEYKKIVEVAHPDNRGLEVAFAWMAMCVLRNPNLGTLADAKMHYEKCLRASMRKTELYGPVEAPPPAVQRLKRDYAALMRNSEAKQKREFLDLAAATGCLEIDSPSPSEEMAHACLHCGKTAVDTGKKLSKCAQCKRVSYCSVECQRTDWKKHKLLCKSKLKPKNFACKDDEQVEGKLRKKSSSVPKEPIDQLNSGQRQSIRMIKELQLLWEKFGEGFAAWWKGLNRKQLKLLMDVTGNTLPKSFRYSSSDDLKRVQTILESGQMSGCCVGFDLNYLLGPCGCRDPTLHFFDHKVLHLMNVWTTKTEEAEDMELQFCKTMVDTQIFPQTRPGVAMRPQEQEDIQVLEVSNSAKDSDREKIESYVASGLMFRASTLTYWVTRKCRIVGLLIKLFDEYQETVRRQPTLNPWERLHGCEHCFQGCESDQEAKKCQTCMVTWWCCKGCKHASAHGKKCPSGTAMESAVLFQF